MQLKHFFGFLLVAIATLPTASAKYKWNKKLMVYEIGTQMGPKWDKWDKWMGRCGGSDIGEGGYGEHTTSYPDIETLRTHPLTFFRRLCYLALQCKQETYGQQGRLSVQGGMDEIGRGVP